MCNDSMKGYLNAYGSMTLSEDFQPMASSKKLRYWRALTLAMIRALSGKIIAYSCKGSNKNSSAWLCSNLTRPPICG